jgi:large subunit ribosomal protein L40
MSKSLPRLVRTFASTPSYSAGPTAGIPEPVFDRKSELLRNVLYPANAHSPRSSSPTGAYHPQVLERVHSILQSPEVHETIERAFHHYKRSTRLRRQAVLKVKYDSMVHACDELNRLTKSVEAGGEGKWGREVYDKAVRAPDLYAAEKVQGRAQTPYSRWKEGRLDGLIPRESWVPVESRGKGWNYEWKQPEDK